MENEDEDIYIYIYIYTHTLEYYSAIKNEIMPFSATWMDLDTVMLSEAGQRRNIISVL